MWKTNRACGAHMNVTPGTWTFPCIVQGWITAYSARLGADVRVEELNVRITENEVRLNTERRRVQTVWQTSLWKTVSVCYWWQLLGCLITILTTLACCPSVWNNSYYILLTLYEGKRDASHSFNCARGIALQSRMLNVYYYILDKRMYKLAERFEVFPDEQHGFRMNRSTETAIRVFQNLISDILSEAKTPLGPYM